MPKKMERSDSEKLIDHMKPIEPKNTVLLSREAYHHLGEELIDVMTKSEEVIGMKISPETVKVLTSDFLVEGSVVIFDKNANPFCFEIDDLQKYIDNNKKH